MGFLAIPGRRFANVADDVELGRDVVIYEFSNLYGCTIGDESRIGTFVEIQRGAVIGRRCRIQSHTFICDGVTIEDDVFIGHGVMFVNDNNPSVGDTLAGTWRKQPVRIGSGANIGSGAVILGGVTDRRGGDRGGRGRGHARRPTRRHCDWSSRPGPPTNPPGLIAIRNYR